MKSFLITSVTFLHPVLCIVVELPDCNCGMEVNPMELGDDTVPRFPWIVAICEDIYVLRKNNPELNIDPNFSPNCGPGKLDAKCLNCHTGTLVSPEYVITAASIFEHIANNENGESGWRIVTDPEAIEVLPGTTTYDVFVHNNYDNYLQGHDWKNVSEIIVHPYYRHPKWDTESQHNVALIRLTEDVELNDRIRPICLHDPAVDLVIQPPTIEISEYTISLVYGAKNWDGYFHKLSKNEDCLKGNYYHQNLVYLNTFCLVAEEMHPGEGSKKMNGFFKKLDLIRYK